MVYYLPIFGAGTSAAGIILERAVLKGKKVSIKLFNSAVFLSIILAMLPFIYFFWKLDPQALIPKNIFIFGLVIAFSLAANLLIFYSTKWENVGKLEPARILEPLFVIFLAIIFSFFTEGLYERNTGIIIPALVAGFALIFSHIKKHHLKFNKYFLIAILGSFFFAMELVVSKLILDLYSPISFYFLRGVSIFLISLVIFRPKFSKLDKKTRYLIFLTGISWVATRVIVYYGFLTIGVIFTTLIIMMAPIFVYLFAHFFLKEKMSWRNFVASIIIAGSVGYAIFFG